MTLLSPSTPALVPIIILFDSSPVYADPAPIPINVQLVPLTKFSPAPAPIAVFSFPSVRLNKLLAPPPVFDAPDVIDVNDESPHPVFSTPSVEKLPALAPTKKLALLGA